MEAEFTIIYNKSRLVLARDITENCLIVLRGNVSCCCCCCDEHINK